MLNLKKVPIFLYYDAIFFLLVIAMRRISVFQSTLSILFLIGFALTLTEIGIRILIKYDYLNGIGKRFFIIFVCSSIMENIYVFNHFAREKMIYFWDSSLYWSTSMIFTSNLFSNFNSTMKMLYSSILNNDYNMVPAILMSVPMKLFGFSYKVYALSIFNLYLLPVLFLTALLVRKIFKDNNMLNTSSLFLTIIVPFLFTPFLLPLMSGYLDAAGMYFAVLLLILIYSDDFVKVDLHRNLSFFLLIVMLLLTRRWYAYFAIGLIISFGLTNIIRILVETKRNKFKNLLLYAVNMSIIGVCSLAVLLVFFREFVFRSLFNNYSMTYSAYQSGTYKMNLEFLFRYIGPVFMLIILAGILFFYIWKRNIYFGSLLVLQMVISFSMFVSVQSFGIQHYYILAVPFCLLLTVGLCWLTKRKKTYINIAVSVILIAILVWNFAQTFEPVLASARNETLLSNYTNYPTARSDIDQIDQMINYLNSLTNNNGKKVYVVASSSTLNGSIVSNAYMPQTMYAMPALLSTHDVDLRDGFPNSFFLADYVVTANPVQYHLRPDDQRVIGALSELTMKQNSNFKLIRTFSLDNGVKANIYKKINAFDKSSIDELEKFFKLNYPSSPILTNINRLSPLIDGNRLGNQHMQIWDNNGILMMDCWNSRKLIVPLTLENNYNKISFTLSNVGDSSSMQTKEILLTIYYDGKKAVQRILMKDHDERINLNVQHVRSVKMIFQVQKSNSANNPMSFTNIKVK